ncbi:hypothetical protein HDV00_011936 [Rhizophlyctis rosea]|nr:hypothetical protein HDV00_011936 [Rhizophlyctis rosea]
MSSSISETNPAVEQPNEDNEEASEDASAQSSADEIAAGSHRSKSTREALFAPYPTHGQRNKKSAAELEAEQAKAERTRLAAMAIAADVRDRMGKRTSSFIGMKDLKGKATDSKTPAEGAARRQSTSPTDALTSNASEEVKAIEQMAATDRKAHIQTDITEHRLPLSTLTSRLSTSVNTKTPLKSAGLSSEAAANRLAENGPNAISPPKRRLPIWKFLQCLANLFNVLLAAAGCGYLIMYFINPADYFENVPIACILIGVAFVNAEIEFYELQKIAAILSSFTTLIPPQADVVRSSALCTIMARDIVTGDVISLRPGSRVPADAIIFYAADCKVDASSLTGENEPVGKWALENGAGANEEAFEAPNLVFNGSVVVSGEAYCIAIRTGDKTILGRIAQLSKHEKKRRSPLSKEIHRFCHTISVLASLTALIFFIIALARRGNFNYALTFGIGIIIAWIPQGLAVTITMLLTIAARRMAQRSVLVKDLHGVETLGAVTMLATDKTGTITANAMTVLYVWTNGTMYFSGPGGAKACPPGERPLKVDASGVAQILHMSATCTRTDVKPPERVALGDATEAGLLRFAGQRLMNIDRVPDLYPKVFEIPFSSDTKTHLTIHRKGHATGGLTMHMKGAPEAVWNACSTIWKDGKAVPIADVDRQAYADAHADMCARGHRVLAFAMLQLNGQKYPDNWRFDREKKNFPMTDLTFVGLVSLEDPPKHGVREAVGQLRIAGIKAVSRRVNIITTPTPTRALTPDDLPLRPPSNLSSAINAVIITGAVLPHLSPMDWSYLMNYDELVFARTSPAQKLEIVTRAQAMGHIVGVTGDGVNDAAALKKADLGIAMNKTGSDVSKEAAGMILLDDDFASIVKGVMEGRLIFQNMKKAMSYSLTHIVPEVLPYLLYVLVPIPQCLTSIQILAVDLGFEIFITLSFAFEPPEDADLLMRLPPRRPVKKSTLNDIEAGVDVEFKLEQEVDDDDDDDEDGEDDGGVREKPLEDGKAVPSNVPLGKATVTDSRMLMSRLVDDEADMLLHDLHRAAVDPDALTPEQKAIEARLRHRYTRFIDELKFMVTKPAYWRAQYRQWRELASAGFRAGERLVDGEVMSWAYLEGGVIECAGALVAFFTVLGSHGMTPADAVRTMRKNGKQAFLPHGPAITLSDGTIMPGEAQYEALKEAQSIFYLSILLIQIWNLFACKARIRLPFGGFMLQ